MSKLEKIKKVILIALGFAAATYFIMSGLAILEKEKSDSNTSRVVESK
jgi:hypothetical protein